MESASSTAATPTRSFGALLRDVCFAPSDAFSELAARPRFVSALAGFVVVQVAFLAVWLSRMDLVEFTRAQAEAAGRPMPPMTAMSASAIGAFKWVIAVSGVAAALLFVFAIAGLLLFVFNFLLGARTSYAQCLSVVAWTSLPTHAVATGLMLTVMALRGEWSAPPDQILQAGVAALLDRASTSKFVYALAQSLDVFWAWMLGLASIGMARAARVSTRTAALTLGVVWLIFVLGKAGLAALV